MLPLEMLMIISLGLLRVSMALIWVGMKGSFGMSWLVCSAGEICFGALRVILMLLDSLVRDWAKLVYAQLWWTSLISFLIRALVGGTFT
jgi:hypothetical protein